MTEKRLHETKILHPRVAHYLHTEGWCYVHEYRLKRGTVDFVAINPNLGNFILVECKRAIPSVNDVAYQLHQYREFFDFKDVMMWLFTDKQLSKRSIEAFAEHDIEVFHLGDDSPVMSPAKRVDVFPEFRRLCLRWHLKEPYDAYPVRATYEPLSLEGTRNFMKPAQALPPPPPPPLVDVSGLKPGIWPKSPPVPNIQGKETPMNKMFKRKLTADELSGLQWNPEALPRITPEIVTMLERLDTGRGVDIMDEGYLTWSEEDRLKRDIVDALWVLLKGEGE